jgi:hypothetical protein
LLTGLVNYEKEKQVEKSNQNIKYLNALRKYMICQSQLNNTLQKVVNRRTQSGLLDYYGILNGLLDYYGLFLDYWIFLEYQRFVASPRISINLD